MRETRVATAGLVLAVRGRAIPVTAKYIRAVKPEQSMPFQSIPPLRYLTPSQRSASAFQAAGNIAFRGGRIISWILPPEVVGRDGGWASGALWQPTNKKAASRVEAKLRVIE